ncbi:MAG: helicase [Flavobacteriaceae bacterium]|jgi:superfamily II DNA or RNA helicase|nr:helicase [Flavobacteriaceae bacterium]MBT4783938.1 helicase [Candidatus Neomarinimicrobiota bacterium]MBT6295534.1 helicase [Nitrospina sp.]MBT5759879.1 helicase [Candidatus Neomarinimicrobiota bacterium]MBT7423682.1 helicase [Candidatus Neomarinimicrobiota bacterium]
MSTKFFTNSEQNTLLRKFEGVFENNKDIHFFDALVGFFRASGYFSIRPHLDAVPNIRILVGINVDKIISKYHAKGLLFQSDPGQTINEFLNDTKSDIQSSVYSKKVEDGIMQFIQDIITKKIEIKAHPTRNLHAKIYIFKPKTFNEHKSGHVITGSSNLTDAGLGTTDSSNYEFNILLNDYEDVKFATDEFEKLWAESEAILPTDIQRIEKETFLKADPTPFELYIKFLIEYFGRSIEFDPNSITDLPAGFKRLSYQVDAVSQGYDLMMKHNGFFLADVVGLGKTVIATLIAKKFFYSNNFPTHLSSILIVTPPAIKDNWKNTCEQFGLKTVELITNGSLHKITNPEKYDLIIVDEAHKFRNDTPDSYDALQRLCKTPTKNYLEDGTRAEKKIILVSATPLNNRPADIRNQVFLFQDGKDSTLDVSNLQSYFSRRIEAYKRAVREPDIPTAQKIVSKIYADIRLKIIEPLTVRRTRTDLMEHELYKKDLEEQGIVFPKIEKPRMIMYQMDTELEKLYDFTMAKLSDPNEGIEYYRYRAIEFLLPHLKLKYRNADLLSSQLAKMMRTLLVKRIDSSFYAFKKSIKRFQNASQVMVNMFEKGTIYIAPNLKVNEYLMDDREDELIKMISETSETDPTIQVCKLTDFEAGFKEGLVKDHAILTQLVNEWDKIDDDENDPKLDEFIKQMKNELLEKSINPNSKLVIFSESMETIDHVTSNLKSAGFDDILSISAKNRDKLKTTISENFDANIKLEDQKSNHDIIMSTEVLAEGINLHRANVIVNYDTPWNATKLMQRIGRVNRIGTTASKIYIYNFYPTAKVDTVIELKKKAIMKLQAFHSALGEDSQIYSPDEEVNTFGLFDQSFEEERDERLVYLMELRKFKDESPEYFRKIKNFPLRSRVGRKHSELNKETVCFIRNDRRDVFYKVKEDESFNELSFVETAELFKTQTDEEPKPLHDQHHEQIAIAVKDFNEKLQKESAERQAVDISQSPAEKSAIAFIDAFTKLEFISEEEVKKIKSAKFALKLGRFQKLQRSINKLKKSLKNDVLTPTASLDALIGIIDKYPLNIDGDNDINPAVTIKQYEEIKPAIIISESFINE